jgi:hypothetical protein
MASIAAWSTPQKTLIDIRELLVLTSVATNAADPSMLQTTTLPVTQ